MQIATDIGEMERVMGGLQDEHSSKFNIISDGRCYLTTRFTEQEKRFISPYLLIRSLNLLIR